MSLNVAKFSENNEFDKYELLLNIVDMNDDSKITKEEIAEISSIFNDEKCLEYIDVEKIVKEVLNKSAEEIYLEKTIPKTAKFFLEGNKNLLADTIFKELSKQNNNELKNSDEKVVALIEMIDENSFEEINNYYQKTYKTELKNAVKNYKSSDSFIVKKMSSHLEDCEKKPKITTKQRVDDLYIKLLFPNHFLTSTIDKTIKTINSENVIKILNAYNKKTNNNFSLISDILSVSNQYIDMNKKKEYIKHIFYALMEAYKTKDIYTDDIITSFNNEIKAPFPSSIKLNALIKQLEKRFEGDMFNRRYRRPFVNYNGKIDENFKQGRTADCWLLAAIKALSLHPKGLEILNNSIKIDENGNATVTLKGVNKTYKFSWKEIYGRDELSSGDLDVRILEMAVNKYFEEEGIFKHDINGNYMYVAFKILTGQTKWYDFLKNEGKAVSLIMNKVFKISDKEIDNFNKPNQIICVSAHFSAKPKNMKCYNTDGTEATIITKHAYAVSRSDKEFVYLINPWDSSKEIKIPRQQFKDFFNNIEKVDLT